MGANSSEKAVLSHCQGVLEQDPSSHPLVSDQTCGGGNSEQIHGLPPPPLSLSVPQLSLNIHGSILG